MLLTPVITALSPPQCALSPQPTGPLFFTAEGIYGSTELALPYKQGQPRRMGDLPTWGPLPTNWGWLPVDKCPGLLFSRGDNSEVGSAQPLRRSPVECAPVAHSGNLLIDAPLIIFLLFSALPLPLPLLSCASWDRQVYLLHQVL